MTFLPSPTTFQLGYWERKPGPSFCGGERCPQLTLTPIHMHMGTPSRPLQPSSPARPAPGTSPCWHAQRNSLGLHAASTSCGEQQSWGGRALLLGVARRLSPCPRTGWHRFDATCSR